MEVPPGWGEKVATRRDVGHDGARLAVQVQGRHLALINHRHAIYAVDATCYHMGGPLLHADIEDLGEGFGPALLCPWHHYHISLAEGKRVYRDMQGQLCALGQKQRVHLVREDEQGGIYVRLDERQEEIASDKYAYKQPPPSLRVASHASSGVSRPLTSGQVMQRLRQQQQQQQRRGTYPGSSRPPGGSNHGASGDRHGVGGGALNRMIASSMHGADGVAPWALKQPPPPPLPPPRFSQQPQPSAQKPATEEEEEVDVHVTEWTSVPLAMKRAVGRNQWLLRFSVRRGAQCLRVLRWGRHLDVCNRHTVEELSRRGDGVVVRPYTPFQLLEGDEASTRDSLFFLVKAYAGGTLSTYLTSMHVGDRVLMRGPTLEEEELALNPSSLSAQNISSIGMLAAGTGITPMLQILHTLRERSQAGGHCQQVRLLYMNRAEEDLALKDSLEAWKSRYEWLHIQYVLTDTGDKSCKTPSGRLTVAHCREYLPEPSPQTAILWCGPPTFNAYAKGVLQAIGHTRVSYCHAFG